MAKTHEMIFFDKKPNDQEVQSMVTKYFDVEAADYDNYNQSTPKRKLFLNKIDCLIANDLKSKPVKSVLSIACGTCFREQNIVAQSGLKVQLTGVDVSTEMVRVGKENGHNISQSDWLSAKPDDSEFDAIFCLYSLGLISSQSARKQNVAKIAKYLKPGGRFYFDVMNIDDTTEWGPEICREYKDRTLADAGYDLGDVFYRRIGSDSYSFFHYFSRKEVEDLLVLNGLKVCSVFFIDTTKNFGELVGPTEGAILFFAEKE